MHWALLPSGNSNGGCEATSLDSRSMEWRGKLWPPRNLTDSRIKKSCVVLNSSNQLILSGALRILTLTQMCSIRPFTSGQQVHC